MPQYLLSIYQPAEGTPSPEELEPVVRALEALNAEMQSAGAWVFADGLHEPGTATVVRASGSGAALLTDGPFAEAKEVLGGITIVRAPDLDAALSWGEKLARATTLPVEVRPFQS
ncbi:hypothetical protein G6045_07515 [Streptomyces sp. YC504]|uniref:YCII-related domain-containing protein n=1 Tax=Streptomyces mesophilus TaxID=1775132 RepID=A0A6G4XD94_9ACTN|nr:YciI family protein [Streptomyces mesophilus]NGO75526.1 hypothetical protein [Streptomyces mesophilus]